MTARREPVPIRIRPLESTDRDAFRAAFERISPRSRFSRFGAGKPSLSERELRYLVDVDHHDHEALVAIHRDDDRPVGVARYVRLRDEPGVAEVAVTIGDEWQGRGVAPVLLLELVDRARDEGLSTLRALVLPSNTSAIELVRRLGFQSRGFDGGMQRYELPLTVSRPT